MSLGRAEVQQAESLRRLAENFPRPLRFLAVGGLGLLTDLSVFTLIPDHGSHPIASRVVSLALATFVTWRLNRAVTFDPSGRVQRHEAARYAAVTVVAQGVSFAVFTGLVLTILARHPQFALVAGAAVGALFSYLGQFFFAFAPARKASDAPALAGRRGESAL